MHHPNSDIMSITKEALAAKFVEVTNLGLDQFVQSIQFKIFRTALNVKCALDKPWLIRAMGPFLWKFREEIADRNVTFFIEREYTAQREDWLTITKGYGESIAIAFEETLKLSLKRTYENDPAKLESAVASMLKMYARYALLCKDEEQKVD